MWQQVHNKTKGSYRRVGPNELYVRSSLPGPEGGSGWAWYVDGHLGGVERGEGVARAAAEAAVRRMGRTHTARLAASA